MINKLLIVDDLLFKKSVQENSLDNNRTIFSCKEAEKILLYEYDYGAIFYLCEKHGFSFNLARLYLDNIINLRTEKYSHSLPISVRELIELKEELLLNGCLDYSYKRYLFFNSEVTLKGYPHSFDKLIKILEDLDISYVLDTDEINIEKISVNPFKTLVEELNYGFNILCSKIENYKTYEDIYIVAKKEYHNLISYYGKLFNLNISDNSRTIADTKYFEFAVNSYLENKDFVITEEIDGVKGTIINYIKEFVDEVSSYYKSPETLKEYLYYRGKTVLLNDQFNQVTLTDTFPSSANYVLVFEFDDDLLSVAKDADFLSDEDKKEHSYLLPSFIANIINKEDIDKKFSFFKEYTVLTTSEENCFMHSSFKINGDFALPKVRYSKSADLLLLNHYYQNRKHYQIVSPLENYLSKQNLGNFGDYVSDMQILVPTHVERHSYSSLKSYIYCPFSYYLKNVLHVPEEKNDYVLSFGNAVHELVETFTKTSRLSFKRIDNENLSPSENYYFNRRLESLVKNREFLDSFYGQLNMKRETEVSFNYNNISNIIGRYDLVLSDNKNYMVIDFKTGDEDFDYKYVKYGFNLQLPIYYLTSKVKYEDKYCLGCFIEPIGRKKTSKLNGFAFSKPALQIYFQDELSNYFSLKKKKTDEGSTEGLFLTEEEVKALEEDVNNHLKLATEGIKKGEFKIAPLSVLNTNYDACRFCNFKDICQKEKASTKEERVVKDE